MSNFVTRIRLRKPRRVVDFVSSDAAFNRDDVVIVQTDRGQEWGTCVLPPEPCSDEFAKNCEMKILRRANQHDQRTFIGIVDEERQARQICLERIQRRGLDMKLVDVEYTFDKRKIVFYFTADERVDFRELVRDLAHDLRARIELRHIQVRDEAKMVGGLGCCGRQLCCASWLAEFMPISMRMAKRQNLSLNPAKISGQCGRLLCCLSYENDMYESPKRRKNCPAECPAKQNRPGRGAEEDQDGPEDDAEPEPERKPAPQKRPAPPREHVIPEVIVYDPDEEESFDSPPPEPLPSEEAPEEDDAEDNGEEDDADTSETEPSEEQAPGASEKQDKNQKKKPRRRGKRGGKHGGRR